MTVTASDNRATYAGNGSTTVFSTVFSFIENSDVLVTLVASDGVETPQAETTHYTLTGSGGVGSITMITAPASGQTLVVTRDMSFTQTHDYIENDPFPADTHESALDKLTMQDQQLREITERALVSPIGTATPYTLPAPLAGHVLAWNGAESNLTNVQMNGFDAVSNASLISFLTAAGILSDVATQLLRYISLQDFGAKGDGTATVVGTDDSAAIALALASGERLYAPRGIYECNSLDIPPDTTIQGDGNHFWQESASKDATYSKGTVFRFNGTAGANSFLAKMSRVAVGVKPVYQPDSSENNYNVKLYSLTFDGNDEADFSLYGSRCGVGSSWDNITVTGSVRYGMHITNFWVANLGKLIALDNLNNGIGFGENIFGWDAAGCNAIECQMVEAYGNGTDGTYNAVTNRYVGYGLGLFLDRTCQFQNVIGELNKGAGIVIDCIGGPNVINMAYLERNGRGSLDSFRAYDVIINPSSANMVGFSINNYYGNTPTGTWPTDGIHPTILIEGTEVQDSFAHLKIGNIFGGPRINAGWSNYELVNSRYSGNKIDNFFPRRNPPKSIQNTQITILYVRNGGTGGGKSIATAMGSLDEALKVAEICEEITTIDIKATTLTDQVITQKFIDRRLVIEGDGTTSLTNSTGSTTAFDISDVSGKIILKNVNSTTNIRASRTSLALETSPVSPTHDGTLVAGIYLNEASLSLLNSAVNCNAMTVSKRGIELNSNSSVVADNSAISNYTAGLALLLRNGGGSMSTDQALVLGDALISTGEGRIFTPTSLIVSGATIV